MLTLEPDCSHFVCGECTKRDGCPIEDAETWCFYAAADELDYIDDNF